MARKVNEELNLTPFIDLFSTLVVFLLLTAVWNQISSLSTNIDNSTSSDTPPPKEKQISLSITIFPDKVQMLEENASTDVPNVQDSDGQWQVNREKLYERLLTWKEKYPKRQDVTLNTLNSTYYGNMITVFDLLVGAGFPEVGVNTQ